MPPVKEQFMLVAMVYSGGARRITIERFECEDDCIMVGEAIRDMVEKTAPEIVDQHGMHCFARYTCKKIERS